MTNPMTAPSQRHFPDRHIEPEARLLTPAQVASLFSVDAKTVTRWAKQGKLRCIRTLGGHRRYYESEILDLLNRPTQ